MIIKMIKQKNNNLLDLYVWILIHFHINMIYYINKIHFVYIERIY